MSPKLIQALKLLAAAIVGAVGMLTVEPAPVEPVVCPPCPAAVPAEVLPPVEAPMPAEPPAEG